MQNALWSLVCLVRSVIVVHWQRQSTPSASASGLFPLGLRTPCSLVPPYPRTPSLWVGSSGRLLFGERKESSPQLGLLLVPSESALRTTPFLVFISECVVSLSLFGCVPSTGEEFVQAHGRS